MFLNNDFLLITPWAKDLYHNYAAKNPIVDYHCHLSPKEIYEDKNFENITEAWLSGDHYKWRLMRTHGIDEAYITGDASDYDKFVAWAKTLPYAIGNPLYAWTHLELKRFFGIDLILNEENAPKIWELANEKLRSTNFTRRNLIANSNVKVICTTDDPIDNLHYHDLIAQEVSEFKVFPAFRPDKALNIHKSTFISWVNDLSKVVGKELNTYEAFLKAMQNRVDYFHEKNCRVADHGIDTLFYMDTTEEDVSLIYSKAIKGQFISEEEVKQYYGFTLLKLFSMYEKKGWVSQMHLKAYRDNNSKMFEVLGPDTGYDAVNDSSIVNELQIILDKANLNNALPKTILYSLNPQDYPALVSLMACFQEGVVTKLQLGSGWWFNDTRSGMRDQLTQLANGSLLGHFVGMLTDSRSFLSYTRHEYFRRVLCELVGEWVSRGELPDDMKFLGEIVSKISYKNAIEYFGFDTL